MHLSIYYYIYSDSAHSKLNINKPGDRCESDTYHSKRSKPDLGDSVFRKVKSDWSDMFVNIDGRKEIQKQVELPLACKTRANY